MESSLSHRPMSPLWRRDPDLHPFIHGFQLVFITQEEMELDAIKELSEMGDSLH